MDNIHPQYTFDNAGNPVGVFLPIDDWNAITEELHSDALDRQKKIVSERLKSYRKNPVAIIDWDNFVKEELSEDE